VLSICSRFEPGNWTYRIYRATVDRGPAGGRVASPSSSDAVTPPPKLAGAGPVPVGSDADSDPSVDRSESVSRTLTTVRSTDSV